MLFRDTHICGKKEEQRRNMHIITQDRKKCLIREGKAGGGTGVGGGAVLRSWCCLCWLSSGRNVCSLFFNLHGVTCPVRVKSDIYSKEGTMLKEEDGKMEVGGSGRHHVWEDTF